MNPNKKLVPKEEKKFLKIINESENDFQKQVPTETLKRKLAHFYKVLHILNPNNPDNDDIIEKVEELITRVKNRLAERGESTEADTGYNHKQYTGYEGEQLTPKEREQIKETLKNAKSSNNEFGLFDRYKD